MSNYLHLSGTVCWDRPSHLRGLGVLARIGAVVGVIVVCWALYSLVFARPTHQGDGLQKRVAALH